MIQRLLGSVLIWYATAGSAGVGASSDSARIRHLENSVLAPCCYQEPVARHQSEIAVKMRLEIAKWMGKGVNDPEILRRYVSRYGSEILVDPATVLKGWRYLVPWPMVIVAAVGLRALIW